MPRRCAVIGCLTKGSALNKSFYRFPNDEELCKKWLKSLCNLQLVKKFETDGLHYLNKNKFVCSDHFEAKHLRNVKAPSQGLFEGAVPTLNINLNVDALISSIQQSEILNECNQTGRKNFNKCSNTSVKNCIEKPNSAVTKQFDEKCRKFKDNIPIKQLFIDKVDLKSINEKATTFENTNISFKHMRDKEIRFEKEKDHSKSKLQKSLKQIKSEIKKESNLKYLPKIEEVFLPSTKPSDLHDDSSNIKSITKKLKSKTKPQNKIKKIKNLSDPLENKNYQLKNVSSKKNFKTKRKKKGVKKKKCSVTKKDTNEKLIKVMVAPKTVNNDQLKLSSEGPKKIIKVVLPQKKVNEDALSLNKIIKFVVPKKIVNGMEINLEKSEINKMLRLLSKNVDTAVKPLGQNSNSSNKLEQASNQQTKESPPSIFMESNFGKQFELVTPNMTHKILKPVCPPKHIEGKVIKLIKNNSRLENVSSFVLPLQKNNEKSKFTSGYSRNSENEFVNFNTSTSNMNPESNESLENAANVDSKAGIINNLLSNTEVIESRNCLKSITTPSSLDRKDINLFVNMEGDPSLEKHTSSHENNFDSYKPTCELGNNSAYKNQKVNLPSECTEQNRKETETQPICNTVETNPVTKELCKHIKHIIEKRFGDSNSLSSDDDSMDTPLISILKPEKTIKKLVNTYRNESKNCSCDLMYQDKMKSLSQEEKELKRKLKNVQKYVFHYKDNIRKRTLLIADLRKQIPVKKPLKTGQLIKTIMPLEKMKEKNPGTYRFSKTLKTFALDLFYSSPLSYNILEKSYFLPSRKTLKNWLTNPKNTSFDLNNEKSECVQNDLMEEIELLDESTGALIRTMVPKQNNIEEIVPSSMEEFVADLEPLQDDTNYDMMFRNDIAEAIMNT